MPRTIVALSPTQMEIREYELGPLETGTVRVKSEFAAPKHGSETAMVKGYGYDRFPMDEELGLFMHGGPSQRPESTQVGNMMVGPIVEKAPDVTEFEIGDRVCGHAVFGELHDFGVEWVRAVPDGMSWKSALCLDPADFAMGAVRDGNVRVGDVVAVFGAGAIGLMTVQLAKLSGAFVISVDPLERRRRAATECGADMVFDPTDIDVGAEIKRATDKRGVDVAIDFSSEVEGLQAALRCIAFGGNVVAASWPAPYGTSLDLGTEAHWNRPNLIFARSCSDPSRDHPRWDEQRIFKTCWDMLLDGRLTGEPIVDPVVTFEELMTAYPRIMSHPNESVKLGVTFGKAER
jgi:threonine dehydrogenase-like Zn-dependent dehydrogenase